MKKQICVSFLAAIVLLSLSFPVLADVAAPGLPIGPVDSSVLTVCIICAVAAALAAAVILIILKRKK